jgi:hypothetical protein
MLSVSRGLACLLVCVTAGCGREPTVGEEDTETADETADETATETATDGGMDTDTEGDESADSANSEGNEAPSEEGEESGGGASCGNGVIEGQEACDGDDLDAQDCTHLGFVGGTLTCGEDCTLDATDCSNQVCGNGVQEGDEECDELDFGGMNCTDLGFGPGLPLCTGECTLDTSPCPTLGEGEACNGFDPCPNDLNCVSNVCYNGSEGDPCDNDGHCESNDCVGATLFVDGVCT